LGATTSDWRVSRLSLALLLALALHGSLLLMRARHTPGPSGRAAQPPAEQLVELDPSFQEPAPEPPPASEPPLVVAGASTPSAAAASRVASRVARAEPASPQATSSVNAAVDGAPTEGPLAAASAAVSRAAAERQIDLGLDGRFFLRPPVAEVGPRARKSGFQRALEASLAADDVQRGLSRGNPLLGSLSAAARAEGPLRGDALVRVTVGADGGLGDVELIKGSEADWSSVLRSFRQLAQRLRLRVPPGARGLRVTFSVKAKLQRPSGKEAESGPVSVAKPSLAPNGLVPHGSFDVADLAGGAQRLVYARIVSEEVL